MIDRNAVEVFSSFEEADAADRHERWKMSWQERLICLERLRTYMYPDGESPPRLQRVLESVRFPPS